MPSERNFLPDFDIAGQGTWLGAQQGFQRVIAQRVANAAAQRKQEQEDLKDLIAVRSQKLQEDQLTQKSREFDAAAPGRDSEVVLRTAQAAEFNRRPQEDLLKHQRALAEAVQKGDIEAAAAAVKAIQEIEKQHDQQRFEASQGLLRDKNRLDVAHVSGEGGGQGVIRTAGPDAQLFRIRGNTATPVLMGGAAPTPQGAATPPPADPDAAAAAAFLGGRGGAPAAQGEPPPFGTPGTPLTAPTADMRNQAFSRSRAVPILQELSALSERINTQQGAMATITGAAARAAAKVNLDDDVALYQALSDSFAPIVARALGHTGVLTEPDVQSAKAVFPSPGNSKTLRDRKIETASKLFEDIGVKGAREAMRNPVGAVNANAPAATEAVPSYVSEDLAGKREGSIANYDDGSSYKIVGGKITRVK